MITFETATRAATPPHDPWLFMAEIEHRVLNEYAVAISTISTAAARSANDEAKAALTDAATRLRDYAAAHRALQAPVTGGRLDLSEYLRRLCVARVRAGLSERGIQLILIEQTVALEADRCWRVGLIVSELITNAMRHAFRAERRGHVPEIVVELDAGGGMVRCRVSDNGLPAPEPSRGGGSQIVEALAEGLGGFVERRFSDTGATVVLSVPV